MGQFIKNALELGHEIWVYPGNQYPGAKIIPTDHISHIKTLRRMDALYIRLENRSPSILSWSVGLRRLLYGFPLVVWEFNTLPDELVEQPAPSLGKKGKFARYSPGCDLAVCVSPSLAEIVSEKLVFRHILTVSNGSDPDLFGPGIPVVPRLLPFQDKFNVVWIGTIKESWHDLEMLGEAAKLVWGDETGKAIAFHLIGGGLSGFMGGMPPNVFYLGAEQYDRLPNWLAGMDVGLSLYKPSKASLGSPLKLFDYMSSGLAVVTTEHPLAGQILKQLNAADYVIPHGHFQALAEVILKLSRDRERVNQRGMAGRQLVINQYNWRTVVKQIISTMSAILQDK